ncbi:MAG: uroporphyrinogen-III synthase, partial [bacterium]|nr:uroporphyrinogen-III synthase [bacterium]
MIKSLNGLRVLNTRPENKGRLLSEQITQAGGVAIDCPTIAIVNTSLRWLEQLPNLNEVNQAIFISANAVEFCFTSLKRELWPNTIHVIA